MTTTPLFHAAIGGQTGLCFALGPTTVFTMMEDERLYRVEDTAQLLIMARWSRAWPPSWKRQ